MKYYLVWNDRKPHITQMVVGENLTAEEAEDAAKAMLDNGENHNLIAEEHAPIVVDNQ